MWETFRALRLLSAAKVNSLLRTTEGGAEEGGAPPSVILPRLLSACAGVWKFGPRCRKPYANDAQAAADAIDEAQQQLNVLYKSVRDAHAYGHTVPELEQATGLPPVALRNVVDGTNPPILPTIDFP